MVFRLLLLLLVALCSPWSAGMALDASLCPLRDNWSSDSDECPCEPGWKPADAQLAQILSAHEDWWREGGLNVPGIAGRAVLCNADLVGADLTGARLAGANLEGASLLYAKLERADLSQANLRAADLRAAKLKGSQLIQADAAGANLGGADLESALLIGTIVTDAQIPFLRFAETQYAPASLPPGSYVEGLEGLSSVVFPPGKQSGLVQLRELIRRAGLRDLERQATFALEHNLAKHARRLGSLDEQVLGWLRLVFFEWTTDWGLHPSRALLLMLGLTVVCGIIYVLPITVLPAGTANRHGVFLVRPPGRIEQRGAAFGLAEDPHVERLSAGPLAGLAWGLYFSLLSAFHIGWRDLNVGSWLTRLQFSDYALRGRGWVRFLSGFQSLVSVYLVALWVLTFFGRPFQ